MVVRNHVLNAVRDVIWLSILEIKVGDGIRSDL